MGTKRTFQKHYKRIKALRDFKNSRIVELNNNKIESVDLSIEDIFNQAYKAGWNDARKFMIKHKEKSK